MSYYVSYDAADRTLAKCFIKINDISQCLSRVYNRLNEFELSHNINNINDDYVDDFITCIRKIKCDLQFISFYDYAVVDITGKKLSEYTELERTKLLKNYLDNSKLSADSLSIYKKSNLKVIIEHQPPMNAKSPMIEHGLTMYYLSRDYDVIHVAGTDKNKITLHKSFELYLQDELAKIPSDLEREKLKRSRKTAKYVARKKHSKETFEEFCKCFGYDYVVKSCSRQVLDDLADSFMQCIAYHFDY